jgi:exodeoxyribonuclease VII small subunit
MSAKAKTTDYQTLSSQLDEVMAAIQAPDVTVDQALAYYQQGTELIAELQKQLKEAENHIKKITVTE